MPPRPKTMARSRTPFRTVPPCATAQAVRAAVADITLRATSCVSTRCLRYPSGPPFEPVRPRRRERQSDDGIEGLRVHRTGRGVPADHDPRTISLGVG